MKMTTYNKALDLAWRYLRMAKQHAKSKSSGKLIEIGPWAVQYPDVEYVATPAVIAQAKQTAFYDQAMQLLSQQNIKTEGPAESGPSNPVKTHE